MTKTDTETLKEYGIDLYKTNDEYNCQLLAAMNSFASQESNKAVSEFKEKLRKGLFRLDMYGPDNMVKMKEFEYLIDKL